MERLKLPVEEFTTPDPVTAERDVPVDELKRLMTEHGVRHLPITDKGEVVGIVSERDLKVVSGLDEKTRSLLRAEDIMAGDPVTVDASQTLDDVAFQMSQRKIGSVLVFDDGRLLGIFTVTDALNALIELTRPSGVDRPARPG